VELEFRSEGTWFKNDRGAPIKGTPPCARRDHMNSATIRVRRDVVEAYIDTTRVISLSRTGVPIGMKKAWKLRSENALGLGCYHSNALIHKLTLIEIRGHGRWTKD
jgi:hypothetical protein